MKNARVKQLCEDIKINSADRILGNHGYAWAYGALSATVRHLVEELAGHEAGAAVRAAFDYEPTPEDIEFAKARQTDFDRRMAEWRAGRE